MECVNCKNKSVMSCCLNCKDYSEFDPIINNPTCAWGFNSDHVNYRKEIYDE